ncbi:MAG: hypothetical protein CMK28_07535, partial [Porticoccaceae bacterium]|nr:hypothetical protein [Porticoccaceae bacterium]
LWPYEWAMVLLWILLGLSYFYLTDELIQIFDKTSSNCQSPTVLSRNADRVFENDVVFVCFLVIYSLLQLGCLN